MLAPVVAPTQQAPWLPTTVAQFLQWQGDPGERYEFVAGAPVKMNAPSPRHEALVAKLIGLLGQLKGNCRVYGSNLGVVTAEGRHIRKPDVTVRCEPFVAGDGHRYSLANPTVIVEVRSSDSTVEHGSKLEEYLALPSLQKYVVLSQSRISAVVYSRESTGNEVWETRVYGAGRSVPFLSGQISLEALYEGVFDEPGDAVELVK